MFKNIFTHASGILYIFLDVDGVLNRESDWVNKFYVRDECVLALTRCILELKGCYSDVRIVICSTWRAGKSKTGESDATQYEALKKKLGESGLKIYGETPISNKGRQAEINYYMSRNQVSDYIVIDDDPSLFESPASINLYTPNYKTGLVSSDIRKIKKQVLEHKNGG